MHDLYTVLIGPALPTLPPHQLARLSNDECRELCRRCLGYGIEERCPCCGREHWSRITTREPESAAAEADAVEAKLAHLHALCASCFGAGRFGGCVACGRTAPPKARGRSGRGFRAARIEPH